MASSESPRYFEESEEGGSGAAGGAEFDMHDDIEVIYMYIYHVYIFNNNNNNNNNMYICMMIS
jgi:hypothetical protein